MLEKESWNFTAEQLLSEYGDMNWIFSFIYQLYLNNYTSLISKSDTGFDEQNHTCKS